MTPRHFSIRSARRSAGVGLITAIFLLVVLAGLGVAMVSVFTAQQTTSTLDEQGARAYQAARAGIEWGVYQRLHNTSCAGATSFGFDSATTLGGFVVTVNCQLVHDPTLGVGLDRWVITATACNLQPSGGGCPAPAASPDYVQRTIEVRL
jgi:MSHA biogenesis protein MshP